MTPEKYAHLAALEAISAITRMSESLRSLQFKDGSSEEVARYAAIFYAYGALEKMRVALDNATELKAFLEEGTE